MTPLTVIICVAGTIVLGGLAFLAYKLDKLEDNHKKLSTEDQRKYMERLKRKSNRHQ